MANNKRLILIVILLCVFGLLMVYSSSNIWAFYKFQDSFHYVKYQSIFLGVGFLLLYGITKVPVSFYKRYSNVFLLMTILLLVLVLIPGVGSVRNGSRSWFGIGSLGIQPSEAAKLSLLIFVSKYLSVSKEKINQFWNGILPILLFVFLIFGLIMLQPDFGTGFIIVCSILSLLFIAGAPLSFFTIGGALGMVGAIALIIMAPYRLKRIISFLNPWKDPLGTGFQMIQSLYAIGPGGLLGLGYLNSIQKHFYLPEPQTDFIFSIITEEFGILGAIIVLGLFGLLFVKGTLISMQSSDLFSKYLSFGITFQLTFQTILNLMVVVGLIPVTGVTLPFISYGGSSLFISMMSIGVLYRIDYENRELSSFVKE